MTKPRTGVTMPGQTSAASSNERKKKVN